MILPITSHNSFLTKLIPSSIKELGDYDLVRIAQDNNESERNRRMAKQALLFRHIAAIKGVCKKLMKGGYYPEECLFSACEMFLTSIDRFDLNNPKQVKFLTYAFWYIRKGGQQWISRQVKKSKVSFTGLTGDLTDSLSDDSSSIKNFELKMDVKLALMSVCKEHKDEDIIKYFYGLGCSKLNTNEIAKALGTDRGYVNKRLYVLKKELKKELCAYGNL